MAYEIPTLAAPTRGTGRRARNHTSATTACPCTTVPGGRLSAAGTTLSGQQPGQVGDQLPGHVEDGTIGDHVEPSTVEVIFGETSSTEGSTPMPGPTAPRRVATAATSGQSHACHTFSRPTLLRKPQWLVLPSVP